MFIMRSYHFAILCIFFLYVEVTYSGYSSIHDDIEEIMNDAKLFKKESNRRHYYAESQFEHALGFIEKKLEARLDKLEKDNKERNINSSLGYTLDQVDQLDQLEENVAEQIENAIIYNNLGLRKLMIEKISNATESNNEELEQWIAEQVKNEISSLEKKLERQMKEKIGNEIKTMETNLQLKIDNIEEIVFKKEIESQNCYEITVEYIGGGMSVPRVPNVKSAKKCQDLCKARNGCNSWTWLNSEHSANRNKHRNTCWLKQRNTRKRPCKTCVSGPRTC